LLDWEGRLVARLAAEALDRVEERGLLAADVRSRAAAHLDVERDSLPEDVVSEEARGTRGGDGIPDPRLGEGILAADVEVAGRAAGREGGDRHRLDHREGVLLHEDAVLEGAGLGLVGVADEVVGEGRLLRHRLPLATRRKCRAAPSLELRGEDLADHTL